MTTKLRVMMAVAALLLAAVAVSAQSKVAVIDLQRAVLDTAEIKKASAALEAKYKPRQTEIEKLRKELEDIQQKLQTMAGKLTQQAEAELTMQGQRKQRDLQRMSEDLQADVDDERNDILGRTSQRMQEVVRKIAEDKSLDLVVLSGNVIFAKPALDITAEATAAYDKAHPPK
ncbi:MAG: OmpH family outer membrane protein [Acidobacteria bacterium]|nr:OmpH family outer membrane protein [Acidobacteriota bacterium]